MGNGFPKPPIVTGISWKEFTDYIVDLNRRCRENVSESGEVLCFALKKGSADPGFPFWRETVRIVCLRMDSVTRISKSYRILTLQQLLNIYQTYSLAQNPSHDVEDVMTKSALILGEHGVSDGTCAICMERKNEALLPCLHAFCTVCIMNWFEHRPQFRCPLCKEPVRNPVEDSWEVADPPSQAEMQHYLEQIVRPGGSNT